jgi:uncharacterized damage-inducible protein DinB
VDFAKHARVLIEYNSWANERVLEQALALDAAQFEETGPSSFGSVRANLQHIVGAQATWLRRWSGEEQPPYDLASLQGLASAFGDSERRLRAFVDRLSDGDEMRIIDYVDSGGVPRRRYLGNLIVHVVNHGTLHRGEAGALLARHERSPGDLDFLYFTGEAP